MCHVSTPAEAKTDLRRRLRGRRSERSEAERNAAAVALAEEGGSLLRGLADGMPLLIAAYLSLPTEPGTDLLIEQAQTDHDAIWVPKVVGDSLDWVALHRSTELTAGPFGIREPVGTPVRSDDLVGLEVVTEAGERVGTVTEVLHLPAQDVLAVRESPEAAEILVPFVSEIVPQVDLDAGRVVIRPPQGLLDPEHP